MVSLIEFSIVSFIIWIILVYLLKKFDTKNQQIPIIGNKILFIILTLFFVGGYGVIFKGGDLIDDLNLYRSADLQMTALFFGLLYGFTFIKLISTH